MRDPLFIASRSLLAALTASLMSGCALITPSAPVPAAVADMPQGWTTPLPHGGQLQELQQWWQGLGDPVLVRLIDAAQTVSPGLASATSRVLQSRAALSGTQSASLPNVDASVSAQRGVNASSPTTGTALQSNLGASWEIDLFGANAHAERAAQARLQGVQAQWHEARVLVAAEVAARYWGWRNCTRTLELLQDDARSRHSSAELTALSAKAGFAAPSAASLARASAAEGHARQNQQQAQCDSTVAALVALTGLSHGELLALLQKAPATRPSAALARIDQLPAAVLAQRPDMYAAERELAAASADLGATQAQRYPRLTLGGSIGTLNYSNAAGTTDLSTWSIGPVSLSLPVLDGGRRAANIDAAQARYAEAAALYRARARQAVREVEDALLALNSVAARQADADAAAVGYRHFFETTQARHRAGVASQMELEEARRTTLAAQIALAQLDLERSSAWISLYRALGGGWNLSQQSAASPP